MPNTRDENISRIWARNANTTIPASPTSGASYRNTGLTDGQKDVGYMFDRVMSSADTNQLLYLVTAILQHLEQRGIAGWSNAVDYVVGALTLGSDGEVYQAARASGPGAGAGIGARDPVTEGNRPTYWGSFTELFGNVPETRRINAGTGLEGGGDLSEDRTLAVRFASRLEVELGNELATAISPGRLRTELNTQFANRDIIAVNGLEGGGNLSTDREIGISDGGVDTDQLANGAVTEPKISTGAITTAKIVDNAITERKLAFNSVTSNKIANGSVTNSELALSSITANRLNSNVFATQTQVNTGTATGVAVNPATLAGRLPSGGFLGNIVTFNNSGTYNAPSGLVRIVVDIWGGGGEGGTSNGATTTGDGGGGGGGGGGGYVRVEVMAADIPTGNIPVLVARAQAATVFNSNDGAANGGDGLASVGDTGGVGGAGGSGGTTGAAGGNGGNGADADGVNVSTAGGGAAGGGGATAGGLGTVLIRQAGQNGENAIGVNAGDGGSAGGDGGGYGGTGGIEGFSVSGGGQNSAGQANDGNDGANPGGGGGGGGGGQGTVGNVGEDGGHSGNPGYGRVVIYEYY